MYKGFQKEKDDNDIGMKFHRRINLLKNTGLIQVLTKLEDKKNIRIVNLRLLIDGGKTAGIIVSTCYVEQ